MAGEIVIFAYETQKNDFFRKRAQVSWATGNSKFGLIEFQTRSYGYLGAYRAGILNCGFQAILKGSFYRFFPKIHKLGKFWPKRGPQSTKKQEKSKTGSVRT